jgi:hypothetical protein
MFRITPTAPLPPENARRIASESPGQSLDCRIMEAIRAAPATWELEGPRITGPSTSLKILQGSFSMICPPFCINHSMFFIHHF